ncbi:hypothetical protein GCM10007874_41350 [Labrys miyagiensis]|uniref:Secreted protein n=1 Tax=Labrys miyagiensis TaxID=346912 RepID=A0ABQ6CLF2_9HYPH|nr:hypothetical protein [Labrys miyagiensis]GLS21118.1 hypothetical protein GCM10007874_41350 [Labrys miyagiensis]
MHKGILLSLLPAMMLQVAHADVRHESFPTGLQGVWAPNAESCQSDSTRITINEKTVQAPKVACAVDYVVERAVPNGTDYSGRGSCSNRSNPDEKSFMNMIIQLHANGQASIGMNFDSMAEYQHCASGQ